MPGKTQSRPAFCFGRMLQGPAFNLQDLMPEPDPELPKNAETKRPRKPFLEIDPRIIEALDLVILGVLDGEWHKVAIIIARATDAAKAGALDVSAQAIAQRIYALVDNKAIESQGNVRRWRAGEIRRKASAI
jgi:hypothetical protein